MDKEVARLVDQTWAHFQDFDESRRMLIAIAGIPGSGKTTLAVNVCRGLNQAYRRDFQSRYPSAPSADEEHPDPGQPDIAISVSLDGFHLTRKQLSEMPNAEEAIFRRGAAFTFDPHSYYKLAERLKAPIEAGTSTIYAPSFDHAVKDPVEMDIPIPRSARIIIFEGLYVALDREGWRDAAELMDETWFIETPFSIAEARVAKRNFAAGISPSLEESLARTRASDMRNGREVVAERLPVQEVIKSVEDETWKTEAVERVDAELAEQAQQQPFKFERMDSIAELTASGAGW